MYTLCKYSVSVVLACKVPDAPQRTLPISFLLLFIQLKDRDGKNSKRQNIFKKYIISLKTKPFSLSMQSLDFSLKVKTKIRKMIDKVNQC